MLVTKPVIAICSMQYDSNFVWSLIDLLMTGKFVGHVHVNTTLLPQARNSVIARAYQNSPGFTHLLFIDDDMADFDINHYQALLDADKDIISALVTSRRPPYTIPISLVESEERYTLDNIKQRIENNEILEAHSTGMAFTLIKREVLDRLVEETPDGPIWFTTDREPRPTLSVEVNEFAEQLKTRFLAGQMNFGEVIGESMAFGMSSHINTSLLGEDISFCRKAKKFEFSVWVHSGVIVSHMGSKPFTVRDTLRFHIDEQMALKYNRAEGDKKDEESKSTIISV